MKATDFREERYCRVKNQGIWEVLKVDANLDRVYCRYPENGSEGWHRAVTLELLTDEELSARGLTRDFDSKTNLTVGNQDIELFDKKPSREKIFRRKYRGDE